MENWEVDFIHAVQQAEAESMTMADERTAAKWRLIDQAMHPKRKGLTAYHAAASLLLLVGIWWAIPLSKTGPGVPKRPELQHYERTEQLPHTRRVLAMSKFPGAIRKKPVTGFISVQVPNALPANSSRAALDVLKDSLLLSAASVSSIPAETPRSRKVVKRSGASLFIPGDSSMSSGKQQESGRQTARRNTASRTGWVTQIKF